MTQPLSSEDITMTPYAHLPVPDRHRTPDTVHDWVLASPFRAHVRRLITDEGLPWRVVAGLADVPDAVVRTLVLGRDGRLRPRIPRRYARALMSLDGPRLGLTRTCLVRATGVRRSVEALLGHGLGIDAIAELLNESPGHVRGLRLDAISQVTILQDQYASAACRAHGIHLREQAADARYAAAPLAA